MAQKLLALSLCNILSKLIKNLVRGLVQKFLIPCTLVILSGHGHSDFYQHAEVCGDYHHDKFERSKSVCCQLQVSVATFDGIIKAAVTSFD